MKYKFIVRYTKILENIFENINDIGKHNKLIAFTNNFLFIVTIFITHTKKKTLKTLKK